MAREAVRAAEAEANVARLNLGYTRVTSPIAGRVSKAEVTEGNLVSGDETLLTTVVSLDPIYAEFEGDEQIYLRYTQLDKNGARQSSRDAPNPVFMGLANEEGFPHEGHMVFVDNQVNPRTGTIRVGLEADLVAYDGDPLADARALFEPRLVVSDGRILVEGLGL